ncbi:transposase [Streptomyces hygroscopicus]|uniref:transposase n=1 Tax=Streptomyces hygroscopicus TaxID=1912 RepID=UPI001FCAA8D0|nr:transposase [Streptomyces hygroscopicus]BDH12821.1 hypothetical protein HOK021_40000 [Streptomyces hygroscopicus]
MIFHNALDIAEIVRQLLEEDWETDPEDLAHISPYLTEHIKQFGEYSTHELGIQPEAYDPELDVDFTRLRDQDLTADARPGSLNQQDAHLVACLQRRRTLTTRSLPRIGASSHPSGVRSCVRTGDL